MLQDTFKINDFTNIKMTLRGLREKIKKNTLTYRQVPNEYMTSQTLHFPLSLQPEKNNISKIN